MWFILQTGYISYSINLKKNYMLIYETGGSALLVEILALHIRVVEWSI
jgi:hypothetical protein